MDSPARRGRGRPPATTARHTRGRIVRAAREVVGEVGYRAASFQAIARRADLTSPAINHHFPNMSALYDELLDETREMLLTAGITAGGVETPLVTRLSTFFSAAMRVDPRDRSQAAFLTTSLLEAQRHAELTRNQNNPLKTARAWLRVTLTEAIDTGELVTDTDVSTLVETMVVVMWGMAFYAGYVGERDDLALVEALERMLANTLWTLHE